MTEIAYAAGAGDRLAAAVRFSDYPEAAKRLPQAGDATRVDMERLLTIKPDLVLGWLSGNPASELARIERMGFSLFVTEPRRLADVPRIVRTVGALAGTQAHAGRTAAAMEGELARLKTEYSGRAPVRVFYEIWHRPLLTVNGGHIISDVLTLCGGRNVFADAAGLTPSVSVEAVLAAKPDVILGGSSAMAAGGLEREWRATRVDALREIPVREIPPDLIQRQTPRIVEGARAVCRTLDEIRRGR